jgi:hypothetical protein
MSSPSDDLMDFALFALDHATDSVLASGGPLVPLALIKVEGSRSLSRFAGDLERGQEKARSLIRSSANADRAAAAWDGHLTVEGERTDAVFVEASKTSDPESVVLAQRYGRAGRLTKKLRRSRDSLRSLVIGGPSGQSLNGSALKLRRRSIAQTQSDDARRRSRFDVINNRAGTLWPGWARRLRRTGCSQPFHETRRRSTTNCRCCFASS